MATPFFYGQETPLVVLVFRADDGHWITGRTIFANGGYTRR